MSHSKEPWSFNDREDITANGETLPLIGISIPMTAGARQNEARANARRIVACVNKFSGIPIEKIESHKQPEKDDLAFDSIVEMIACHQRDTYRDLCGELLKQLKDAQDTLAHCKADVGYSNRQYKTAVAMHCAITKAEAIMGENSNE